MSSKSWVFTINNHDGERDRAFLEGTAGTFCTYMAFQCEIAPGTGTPHIQGYLYLASPRTMRGVKQTVFGTERLQHVHLEIARGSRDECYAYVSKEDSRDPAADFPFQEFGRFDDVPERRGQGQRSDLHAVSRAVLNGGTLKEIAMAYPESWIKFNKGIRDLYYMRHSTSRTPDDDGDYSAPNIIWLFGPTGTGKTRQVFRDHPPDEIFRKTNGDCWFDGYHGQKVALFDDFRAKWFSFSFLLNVTDRYPLTVGVKNSTVSWSPTHIYFTCPKHPEDLFSGLAVTDEGSLQQLVRRLSEIRYVGPEGTESDHRRLCRYADRAANGFVEGFRP